jgi:predicted hydrocarbon binding protein
MEPKEYPKGVILFLYDPKKRFVHVPVVLKNQPGALSDVTKKVTELKLNVLSGFTSVEPGKATGLWSSFAECPPGEFDAKDLESAISKSNFVEGVRVVESRGGLLTDSLHFPLRMTPGRRAIGFNPTSIASMFRRVYSTFGSGGVVIVYEEGRAVGRQGGMFLLSALGKETLQSRFETVSDLMSGWRWGKVESVETKDGFSWTRIRVRECFESMGGSSAGPLCHFVRGVLEGILEIVSGLPMKATEVRCSAMGNEYCEFEITARKNE